GRHEQRPRNLIVAEDRGRRSEHAAPAIIEGNREITRLAFSARDLSGRYKLISLPYCKFDLTAKPPGRAIIHAKVGLPYRVIAQHASGSLEAPARERRKNLALAIHSSFCNALTQP